VRQGDNLCPVKNNLMRIALILATVIIFYWRTIWYHGIIDDLDHIKTEKTPKFWRRMWEHFWGIKFTNLKLAHALNIAVHASVCVLIYLFFEKTDIALLTSLLFAINPVNNQCSIWLSGRVYAVSTAILLTGFLFLPALPILYGLANWWTINTLFTPLLFLFLKPSWLGLLLPIGLFVITKKAKNSFDSGKSRFSGASDVMREISFRKLFIVFRTLGYYIALCILPFRLGMCHEYLGTFGMSKQETDIFMKPDRFFLLGILATGAVVVNIIHPFFPPLFGLLWFILFTAQWLNFIVITHLITERYVYLANIGLMYLLANLIIGTPFMWAFLVFYAVRLYYFIPAYKDYRSYWNSNTMEFPHSSMGWNQLGIAQLQYGNSGSALDSWVRGVQERPHDFRLNYNTANLLMGSGMAAQAVPFVKAAEANLDQRNNYAFWREQVDKLKEAITKQGVQI
jgi:hypothetical protein